MEIVQCLDLFVIYSVANARQLAAGRRRGHEDLVVVRRAVDDERAREELAGVHGRVLRQRGAGGGEQRGAEDAGRSECVHRLLRAWVDQFRL